MSEDATTTTRYRFVLCEDRRILVVDYTGLSPEEHIRELDPVRQVIVQEPPHSLLLMHLANERFTAASADAIKDYTHGIDPHVRANAVVCRPGFRVAFNAVLNCEVRHEIRCFEQESDAMAWLAEQATAPRDGAPSQKA